MKFARTPVMSTYLLAFVVGEFDYVEDFDRDGKLVRVYTPMGKSEQGKFALEVCFHCITMSLTLQKIPIPVLYQTNAVLSYLGCCENTSILYRLF